MNPIRLGTSLVGAAGVATYTRMLIGKNFPAKSKAYKFGDQIVSEDGKTKQVVIGYFGADNTVFEKGVDMKTRPLYYADKKTAQSYAVTRGKNGKVPQVGMIVADRLPKLGTDDHEIGRFEGFDPLSPKFMHRANVRVMHREVVTEENRLGLMADVKRMIQAKRESSK